MYSERVYQVCRSQGVIPALALSALAAACTGGGGDNVTLTKENQGQDPVVLEVPVAWIKRSLPESATDLRDPLAFVAGARLLIRERASATADDIDITPQIAEIVAAEEGVASDQLVLDIKDLESSFDGERIIFAARVVPEPVADNLENTTWNLWLYDTVARQASYLIPSRLKRNEGMESGGAHDIAPHFLGDDRIVFSSTRQVATQARLLNEGRPQLFAALDEDGQDPAAVLHIYDPRGRDGDFKQISFNLSHDLDPVVLDSGEVVFSRWNNTATDHISLFRINPDGHALSPLYGFHSQSSGTDGSSVEYTQPRQLDDGRLLSLIKPFASPTAGGVIATIETADWVENDQPVWGYAGAPGPGQEPLTDTEVRTDGLLSAGGQFGSAYPLRDGSGRLLTTWSQCRVLNADGEILPCTLEPDNTVAAPVAYGAWIYDPSVDTQRPVVLPEEGYLISEIIALEARPFPSLAAQAENFNADLAISRLGLLRIDSVYDLDGVDNSPMGIANHAMPGTAAYRQRPARFLRIVLPVPLPDDAVFEVPGFALGVSSASGFREIAGYVPIEPDGSVTTTVPAEQAFSISLLDVRGRRIGPRHDYWLQVGAGETLHCTGCHTAQSELPHGRLDSQPISSNPGARQLASGELGFPGTNASLLFATQPGQTMAATWDFHRPLADAVASAREMSFDVAYSDEWTDRSLEPDPPFDNRGYPADWNLEPPLIVENLDPVLPGRIVINYADHIQPIWERVRNQLVEENGVVVDTCIACHSSQDETVVAAGQLDLEAKASDIDPDQLRSYRELLSADAEQWLDLAGNLTDRQRICSELDDAGNELTVSRSVFVRPVLQAGRANGSASFFACFEGGECGRISVDPLPENCTEDGGVVVPATRNTIDHGGLLTPAELRLLSEWLDIGAQYFNNPFDPRLAERD